MKLNKYIYSVILLSLGFTACDKGEGFVFNDNHIFDTNSDISRMSIIAGHSNTGSYGSYIDLVEGKIHYAASSILASETIDIVYQHSGSNGANLLTTDASTLSAFSAVNNTVQQYATINASEMIKIKAAHANLIPNYDSITTSKQIFDALTIAEDYVNNNPPDANISEGPGDRMRSLAVGDIIFFKSFTRDAYAVLRITNITAGTTGNIRIDVKSTNKQRL